MDDFQKLEMDPNLQKLLLLQQQTNQPIEDNAGNKFVLDASGKMTLYNDTFTKGKDLTGESYYQATIDELARQNSDDISAILASIATPVQPAEPIKVEPFSSTFTTPAPEVDLTEAGKEASKKINIDRQRMNKIVGLGVPALIGLGQAAYQFSPLSETEQDVYAKEELARLRGTDPGMSAAEQSQYFQQIYAPQKAALAETERRREAGMATQGGVRSAASLMAERGATAQAMGRALEGAGVALNQAQMQEVEKDIAKKEALIAYQGQRRQARTDAGFEALTDLGALAGMAMGGRAVGGVNLASDIVGIATQQGVNLSASQISDLNKDLTKYPMMTENYLNKTLRSYGINPDSLTETQKQAFFRS